MYPRLLWRRTYSTVKDFNNGLPKKSPSIASVNSNKDRRSSPVKSKSFRPINTLASPLQPTFTTQAGFFYPLEIDVTDKLAIREESRLDIRTTVTPKKMAKERSPSRTSVNQPYQNPLQRQPLANISAKMRSSNSPTTSPVTEPSLKPAVSEQPEFGKASPLRNPLRDRYEPEAQFRRPMQPELPNHAFVRPKFYLPGQTSQQQSRINPQAAGSAAQKQGEQPYKQSRPAPHHVAQPSNAPRATIYPPARPTFSSIGPNTTFERFQPAKPVIDLTRNDDDDEGGFDVDAALRETRDSFGAADPYMYVDPGQASENLKNLLEGAFDDADDKVQMRLRKRAKKAAQAGDQQQAKSLADKLASLQVAEEEKKQPEEDEQEDDGTVEGLAIKLLPHQVEGVSWMINKEIGMQKKKGMAPKGGILADDMGLGKTIQSVSLILTNARPEPNAKPEYPKQKMPGQAVGKGTLVVAPLALIKQWEGEIKTRVSDSHALRVLVHHGPSRTKSSAELKKYDVVITTYQTLTSEHAGSNMTIKDGPRIGCFGVHWYRLILDEAHSIKNRNAKSTQACYALESWYRWCLTGTPMQNNLDELQSLIKFLRIKPYCEYKDWKDAITTPMKNGRGGLAMRRLQVFLGTFMKRRTKEILKQEGALNFGGKANESGAKSQGMQIVKREVLTVECDFDDEEQTFYTRVQARADRSLQAMSKNNDYIGALVLLLRLRQVCDHPRLIEGAMDKDKDALSTGTSAGLQTPRKQSRVDDTEMDALAALMGNVTVEAKKCGICQIDLSSIKSAQGVGRCAECDADLAALNGTKTNRTQAKKTQRRARHRLPDESDNEDDSADEGEWIGKGPERRINLGIAGGDDDEDAEGGGESLGPEDSDRSDDDDDEEDSPPRARTRRRLPQPEVSDDSTDDEQSASDESSHDDDNGGTADDSHIGSHSSENMRLDKPSTKIRQLLRILHSESPKHKVIVFSQFTTMLNLIEPYLDASRLKYVRYDGSMRNDAREASLHTLRTDKSTRVLLCSLKCGSLGLNLTAASRVVIVEPFWNPFVEEQAIDRVHRLNQTVDVKVFRLTIRNTVEERILALQERKRELAKAAIEGGSAAVGKLSMKDILSLFKRDAEHGVSDERDLEMAMKFGGDQRLIDGASGNSASVRDNADRLGSQERSDPRRTSKPQKRVVNEHAVYGRRW
nr:putative atp-dependent helicase [Quercus suber]